MSAAPKPFTEGQERRLRRSRRLMAKINIFVYRKTNGRLGGHLLGTPAGICLITTTGRRSGMARTVPVLYLADGAQIVVVASLAGSARHPEWYLNLVANPKVTLDVDGDAQAMLARTANADERDALWPKLVEMYPTFDKYQARTEREIPVVVCAPEH